jgi:tetratricopeptide (TPR) repeat protein
LIPTIKPFQGSIEEQQADMERVEKTVFISYRRTNFPWAMAIYQDLVSRGYDVFLDFTGIGPGDFEQVILANIRGRAHFLVLLTPSALERCDEPGDWLRREIEEALDSRRNIVPIFLDDFNFASPAVARHLTGKLELLKRYNGLKVPMEFFRYAMTDLHEKRLSVPLDSVLHLPPAAAAAAQAQNVAASAAAPVKQEELTAQQWFERGFNAMNPDEKTRSYSEAIRLAPDFGEAYCIRCIEREAMGDHDGAIRDYDEAIRLKPEYGDAFCNRGAARHAKGDLDGAMGDFDEAIRLQPEDAMSRNNRGAAWNANGDLDGAIADFSEAIRLKPDFALAFYNRAGARRRKWDLLGAWKDASMAVDLGFKR